MGKPTSLQPDLVPKPTQTTASSMTKRPPKSQLDEIWREPQPEEAQSEKNLVGAEPRQYQERIHFPRAVLRAGHGNALPWEPAVAGSAPTELEPAPRKCMYTGDDLPPRSVEGKPEPRHRDEAWRFGAGLPPGKPRPTPAPPPTDTLIARVDASAAPAAVRCVFTGDDLPRAPVATASQPEALRRLQQWKTRMVMPERLESIGGFDALKGLERDGGKEKFKQDREWQEELAFRAWNDETRAKDVRKRRDEVDKLIADKQVNAYGERLPPRARGELLPPWAPREELGVPWRT